MPLIERGEKVRGGANRIGRDQHCLAHGSCDFRALTCFLCQRRLLEIFHVELEGTSKTAQRLLFRAVTAAFCLLNGVYGQAGRFGEVFLREAKRFPQVFQLLSDMSGLFPSLP